ncbi:MAG: TlpA family protein disulfide reductase [Gemmatimonadetes bacterium]|nr:TlpA family protein disulfide reductase [Gemmatimonadota bacterium]
MRKFAWILAAVLCTAATAPASVGAQDVGLAIGSRATPLVLEDLDGKPVNLGQYIGKKPVVMEFWAAWCSVCAALQPRLDAAERRFGRNVQFVTVAVGVNQTTRSIKRHLEKHRVSGVLVWDKDGRATRAYEAPATSYIVVLDRRGRVAYTGSGEDQDLNTAITRALAAR